MTDPNLLQYSSLDLSFIHNDKPQSTIAVVRRHVPVLQPDPPDGLPARGQPGQDGERLHRAHERLRHHAGLPRLRAGPRLPQGNNILMRKSGYF